ncbi:hypothetical protein G7046_g6579 [Stylonectria norvegica]|nr:hypothetical protein G7046_g6579 [Stylonectria norvegica]
MATRIENREDRSTARTADVFTLPSWTRADDSDDSDDDCAYLNLRRTRFGRRRRRDIKQVTPTESSVAITTSIATSTSTKTSSLPTPTPTPTADDQASASDSEDEGLDSFSESEAEDEGKKKDKDMDRKETPTTLPTSSPSASLPEVKESATITNSHGTHSDVHKTLIAVGSIGGFILLLGLCLIAYKLTKRSHRRKTTPPDEVTFRRPSRVASILAKLPFLKTRSTSNGWSNMNREPAWHIYDKKQPIEPPMAMFRQYLG